MIIDETFMWLYAAFKVGRAFLALAAAGALSTFISFAVACEMHASIKPTVVCAVFSVICLFVALMTPDYDEVKGYAFYRISTDVVDPDAEKRLFEATLKVMQGKE